MLGFTNVDNAGVSGLELKYNDVLTGQNGVVLTAVNAWGYTLEQSYETEKVPLEGSGLRLTVDANIQHYLENALDYAVKEHHVAARAVGIVMDVNTGAVLAMSTTPAYDPNQPRVIYDAAARKAVDALTGSERAAALQLAQQTQWRNKAVSDLYEPGSVFKLITCAAALDAGAVSKKLHLLLRRVHLGGGHTVPLRQPQAPRQPDRDPGAGKFLQPELYPDRRAAGQGSLLRLLCRFRPAGANRGRSARRTQKESVLHRRPHGAGGAGPPAPSARAARSPIWKWPQPCCAVVNGGRLMQPYLVSDILNPDGSILQHTEPVCRRQVIKPETSETMREMMEAAVLYGGGRNASASKATGWAARAAPARSWTAPTKSPVVASFVAVAPTRRPAVFCVWCAWTNPTVTQDCRRRLSAPVCAEVLEQTCWCTARACPLAPWNRKWTPISAQTVAGPARRR